VQKKVHFAHASNDRAAGTAGIPCAMGYGLYVISSVRRAFWPPSLAEIIIRELDPSIGGSGPHDFAVRKDVFVRACALNTLTSIASRFHVRDDRDTPLR